MGIQYYQVSLSDLFNKTGERIAVRDSVITTDDLPTANRTSVPWLIEQGYLVPVASPAPAVVASPKKDKEN